MPTNLTVAEIEAAFWALETKRPQPPDPAARREALTAVSFTIGFEGNDAMMLRFVDAQGGITDLRLNPVVAGALQGAVNGLAREIGWFDLEGIVPAK